MVCIPQILSGLSHRLIPQFNTYKSHQRISLTELVSEIDHVLLFGKNLDLQKYLSSLGDRVHFFKDMEDATIDSVICPLILAAIWRPLGMTEWLFASDGDAELFIPRLVSRGMRVVLVRGIGQQNQTGQQSQTWREKLAECVAEYDVYVVDLNPPHIKTGNTRHKEKGGERCSRQETKVGRIEVWRAFSLENTVAPNSSRHGILNRESFHS